MTNVEILDSTLRDGSQGEGISYSVQDKIHIVQALDELGVKYIEAGNPGSNPKDMEFFQKAKELKLKNSRIVAFGSTRRKDVSCAEDVNLQSLLSAETQDVVIFGKTWDFQATEILHASLEENLEMIEDTCAYLRSRGRNVIFDAEHFFTGYKANPEYALKSLEAAVKGGGGPNAHPLKREFTLTTIQGLLLQIQLWQFTQEQLTFRAYFLASASVREMQT